MIKIQVPGAEKYKRGTKKGGVRKEATARETMGVGVIEGKVSSITRFLEEENRGKKRVPFNYPSRSE